MICRERLALKKSAPASIQAEAPVTAPAKPASGPVARVMVSDEEESINSGNDLDWMDQEDFESVETKFRDGLSAQIMEALDYHDPRHCTYIADME